MTASMTKRVKTRSADIKRLTIELMTNRGYDCFDTEHHSFGRTYDLFGFCDVLCLSAVDIVAVQATSRSNISARIRKIEEHENLAAVRKAGIRILVQGWDGPSDSPRYREVDIS